MSTVCPIVGVPFSLNNAGPARDLQTSSARGSHASFAVRDCKEWSTPSMQQEQLRIARQLGGGRVMEALCTSCHGSARGKTVQWSWEGLGIHRFRERGGGDGGLLLRNSRKGNVFEKNGRDGLEVSAALELQTARRPGAGSTLERNAAGSGGKEVGRSTPSDGLKPGTRVLKISKREAAAEALAASRAKDIPTYDPQQLNDYYKKRPLKVWSRSLNVLFSLGSFGVGVLLDRQTGKLERNMRARAIELRERLSVLGPTFVKIGQALSTRPDLCPPAFLDELAELQDALPTFSDVEAFNCIERELGAPMESLYESISPSPIAAASLGQVYKARLRGSGTVVAVKVQRPGIEESVGLDFYLIRNICGLVDEYVTSLTTPTVGLLDEFAKRVYQELNYVQEGRNARRFKHLYERADILVPAVYWECTSGKVLTMEWVQGTKLSEQAEIERQGLNVLSLVETGIQCSLRQLLEHGYFHADPHPGNLLATEDGRLAFLDFGMMSETPSQARFAIIGHVVHLVNRDYEAMAQDYYALDFLEPQVDVSPIVPALRGFFDDVLNASVSELNFKTIVDGLGAVLYQYPFNVPAYYALILRSLTVLEGLALYTDPSFKVLAAAYPYMAKRLLTDPNPYLRDALIDLLWKDGYFRWNRLENLLMQGKKDSDYRASEALQPLLALLLGPEGQRLRLLVEKEAVRVMEALILGGILDASQQVPSVVRDAFRGSGGSAPALVRLRESEQEELLELRDQVLRIWTLLRSSASFDPATLQPLVDVLAEPEAQVMGSRVAGGVLQRLAARLLQQLLRPQPSLSSSSPSISMPA
eukprot:TRINITY_DN5047_c0_g2_i1.p1 TRINITY_DN5047_c0_g2~~TRINITY_DN5047_c0_g2_i1.p1  ORF type:complete len:816 (+),score=191.42 TRINITY_DN5047_c0_g2_i1:218-2665(+)